MSFLNFIITGAENGIGFQLTRALAEDGHRIAGLDLEVENLTRLQVRFPEIVFPFQCDITDPEKVNETVRAVLAVWDRVDVLVNNACLAIFQSFEEKTLRDTRREFEVNYFGCLNLIAAVLPDMKRRGQGTIYNVSSGVGLTGFPGLYGYSSTKGAIEALSRTLAVEFRPYGIQVGIIHPPLTETKSSAPLNVPRQMKADATEVGNRLARKIGTFHPVITPDIRTKIGLVLSRCFPGMMGRLFGRLEEKQATPSMY